MKKLILFLLSTFFFQISFAQNDPVLAIDGVNTTFKSGLSLPYWLKEGQTINIVNNVKSVSILEFIVEGNNLKFSQVISLTTQQTVPTGKAWKIEGLGLGNTGATIGGFSNNQLPTIFTSPKIFETSGTYEWVVPPGVTNICVEVWGGGGGPGGNYLNYYTYTGAGGGGGGGYGYQCFSVTPGSTFIVTVGNGGSLSGNGGTSSVGSIISASGGEAGQPPTGTNGGAGGNGGSSTATYSITGKPGQSGINSYAAGIGGDGANGGTGAHNGYNAAAPGGGGSNYMGSFMFGASGKVIIYW